MSTDADAREGRGAANGCNKNWYNSPLWDNIGPKKKKVYEASEVSDTTEVAKPKTEEELIRERQRAAFKYAY